jgi:hypothetical protein
LPRFLKVSAFLLAIGLERVIFQVVSDGIAVELALSGEFVKPTILVLEIGL